MLLAWVLQKILNTLCTLQLSLLEPLSPLASAKFLLACTHCTCSAWRAPSCRLKFRIANRFLGVYKSHNRHTASIIKFKIFFSHFLREVSCCLLPAAFCSVVCFVWTCTRSPSHTPLFSPFMFAALFIEIYCIALPEHACPARLACCCLSCAPHGVYLLPVNIFVRLFTCSTHECVFWVMCFCTTVLPSASRIVRLTLLSCTAAWWKLRKRSVNQKFTKGFARLALRSPRSFLHAPLAPLSVLLLSYSRCP